MATKPTFASVPVIGIGQVTTADTSRTAPTSPPTVVTGVAAGTRVERVRVQSTATIAADTVVRLWIHDGSAIKLYKEILMKATTPSVTVEALSVEVALNDLVLPSGYSIRASIHTTDTMNVFAFGSHLT